MSSIKLEEIAKRTHPWSSGPLVLEARVIQDYNMECQRQGQAPHCEVQMESSAQADPSPSSSPLSHLYSLPQSAHWNLVRNGTLPEVWEKMITEPVEVLRTSLH